MYGMSSGNEQILQFQGNREIDLSLLKRASERTRIITAVTRINADAESMGIIDNPQTDSGCQRTNEKLSFSHTYLRKNQYSYSLSVLKISVNYSAIN